MALSNTNRVSPKTSAVLLALALLASLIAGCGDSSPEPATPDSTQTADPDNSNQPPDPAGTPDPNNPDPDVTTPEPTNPNPPLDTELPALPNPPLTPAPSADDEPLVEAPEFNASTNLTVLRDPGPRLPEKPLPVITEEEFAAGPLPAVIQTPADVDPAVNSPPFFDNLQDQQIFAGQLLEVVFRPLDADGGVPGMFPQELPEGAAFVDNFDGSKTLVWRPLQMDIGIREFTAVALDPVNSQYRTSRTIRIKIDAPDDLSTIPNVAPRLEELAEYTTRVDDPSIIELKGIDLNGTVPTLEIAELPDGASFVRHPRFEEIFVLKLTPTVAGPLTVDVTVRDAVDSSLTVVETITIDVRDRADFARAGARLRNLATNRGIMIGYASRFEFFHRPDSGLYTEIAAQEFDLVTPENAMKMDYLNPFPGRFQFAETDNLVSFAQQNGMTVHAHPLVWHRQLPDWILETSVSERKVHMREYIDHIMTRYQDTIPLWDVVNEPLEENGTLRNSIWFEAMGEEYINTAFRQARLSAPNATLLLNEYDIAAAGPKSDGFFSLLDRLQQAQTPIDGVGFQLHLWSDFNQFDDVRNSFQKAAERNLDIYVTELDVAIADGGNEQQQAEVYRQIMTICLQQERCKALQTWGFTDQYSWRRNFSPLIFDRAYQPKPAYSALQEALTAP